MIRKAVFPFVALADSNLVVGIPKVNLGEVHLEDIGTGIDQNPNLPFP